VAITNPTKQAKANKKNIYITYICVGVIAWFPLSSLMYGTFDLFGGWLQNPRIFGMVELSNLVAMIFSGLIVFGLIKSESVYQFTNEVFMELSKVSWPIKQGTGVTRWEKFRELRESTIVVLVGLLVLAVIVGVIDFVFQTIIKLIF